MATKFYARYDEFLVEGNQTVVPYVKLPQKNSDKNYIYRVGVSRLDKISQDYYGTPTFGWLIMIANPSFGGEEWNILDGSVLTIPYPLIASLQDYNNQLDNLFFYYGR
jgi:hypothetical protein